MLIFGVHEEPGDDALVLLMAPLNVLPFAARLCGVGVSKGGAVFGMHRVGREEASPMACRSSGATHLPEAGGLSEGGACTQAEGVCRGRVLCSESVSESVSEL